MVAGRRIDQWLFFARLVKSRTLAQKIVEAGSLRINRQRIARSSTAVHPGDVITLALEARVVVARVRGVGERRERPEQALGLYEDLSGALPSGALQKMDAMAE